ncbi:hypothetical protein BDV93DRAFT_51205 [Ceratobasidium sp. AG-I]|nr:hypothetical protein BDV93DRAFT_51205 [Ceratobasidium sp. AG-I]
MKKVAKLLRNLIPTLRGPPALSFTVVSGILEHLFQARDEFSKVYMRIPGFGWPLVLMKIWPRIKFPSVQPIDPYEKIEGLGQLRDLANRCLLVALPYERCVAEALTGIDCIGNEIFVEDPFEEPKDFRDLEIVTYTLLRRLSSRPAEKVVGGLKHLSIMAEYVLRLSRTLERQEIYPRLLPVAYARLWTELTFSPDGRYPVNDVAIYGAELLRQTWMHAIWNVPRFGKHNC